MGDRYRKLAEESLIAWCSNSPGMSSEDEIMVILAAAMREVVEEAREEAKVQPKYMVEAGTGCCISRESPLEWVEHTTTKDVSFERYEKLVTASGGGYYQFRLGSWLLLVHKSLVVHKG